MGAGLGSESPRPGWFTRHPYSVLDPGVTGLRPPTCFVVDPTALLLVILNHAGGQRHRRMKSSPGGRSEGPLCPPVVGTFHRNAAKNLSRRPSLTPKSLPETNASN